MSSTGTATTLGAKFAAILTDPRGVPGERAPLAARLKYALVIRRYEFLPVYVPLVLTPALLGARSWGEFASLDAVLALVYVISGLQVANMTNALADREQDRQLKSRQSDAVYGLGVPRVVTHIAVSTAVCGALALYLTVRAQQWEMLLPALAAGLIGFQYSLPPLHLKSAGLWQLLALQNGCVFLPGLFVLWSFGHPLEWGSVVAVLGFALALTSLFVTSHGEDYLVDGRFGIRTYVRALGLVRAFRVQLAMLVAGGVLILVSVPATFGFTWGLLPFLAAWLVSIRFLDAVVRDVRRAPLHEAVADLHGKSLLGPYHSSLLSWATVVLAASVLIGR
ncbi:UbiA family prenyltransferase [Streptomyces kanasensis]|uniref:UbiA family prenyltransferase n=1 Tax=Streptomyces kanasensis TaxID=936756 RepID=UPI0036F745B6